MGLRNSALCASVAFVCTGTLFASAADVPTSGIFLSPTPVGRVNPFSQRNHEYSGMPIGGWMLYPTLKLGVALDDNIYGVPANRRSAAGIAAAPSFVLRHDNGIHNTTLFSDFSMRFYSADSRANTIDGRAGLVHVWEIQRDLLFRVSAGYTRSTEVNAPLAGIGGGPVGVTPSRLNTFNGSASLQKAFGDFFVASGGSVSTAFYEDIAIGGVKASQSFRDGTAYMLAGRAGYWFTPLLYGFVEPSVNWKRYDRSLDDNEGHRIVGGVGTGRIGLFKGEIHAGYQRQHYKGIPGDVSGGVYGVRLHWYPTRDLTFAAQVDRSLGLSTRPGIANISGSPTLVTSASLKANFDVNRSWSAYARIGYQNTDYRLSARNDDQWNAGLGAAYKFSHNLGVSADYAFARLNSNAAFASYTRNIFTLSAVYQY